MSEELEQEIEQEEGTLVAESGEVLDDAPIREEHEQESEGGDEEGHDEETPEEADARKERNRQRRLESKQRRKDYVESLKRELQARDHIIQDLNNRMSIVERKSTGSEMAQLNKAEQDAITAYNQLRQINAKAIEQANGPVAMEAQEKMFLARQRVEQLRTIKQQMSRQQSAPQPLDPRLVNHAKDWMARNQWYDPSGKDDDSAIALTVDKRMAEQGWDPTTAEYWEELEKRVKKHLPHRANSGYNKRTQSGGRPVSGSGRESASSGSSTYRLSPDRVQALKDAGMWDDPKARAEAIKRFRDYDKGAAA